MCARRNYEKIKTDALSPAMKRKPLHRLPPSGVVRRDVECWSSSNARANDYHTDQIAGFLLCAPALRRVRVYKSKLAKRVYGSRFTYSEPLVVENLLDGDPMIYVSREHSLYEVFRRLADRIPEWCLHLQIQLNWNYSRTENYCVPRTRTVAPSERY